MDDHWQLHKEIRLDATPEEVWEAVSTGQGIASWFVPHEFDANGEHAVADFGSGNEQTGVVLRREPGRRIVFGNEDGNEAMEFLVEASDGGSTVLRLVQSGLGGEDWEREYHSKGWDLFLYNLTQYLTHFRGQPVVNVLVMGFTPLDSVAVWERFRTALGIRADLAVGDRVELEPDGLDPIRGVVDVADHGLLGIRTDHALYRFGGEGADAWGMVNAFHYFYGVDIDRAAATARWQAWLDRLFPPPEQG
ncbi:SRPBCC domain-containing protein [Haloechinothrix sp. LS1_15]|uniref:SRPBCC family protein n=1 Tax=Haloechinothrix sp. LS1_15 TaxID=2652248 RepID=UPI0029462F97|nr:SRPBCC domain-containing protein [Haloechinothrix sp. LS1_15]MDV6012570.1 SRPBCC domain-containing protein [Haloechinothrix sp. LS1_15]